MITTTMKTILMSTIYLFANSSSQITNTQLVWLDDRAFKLFSTDSNDNASDSIGVSGVSGWPGGGGGGGGWAGGGVVPLYLKILASIFYSISIVLGVGGNTLVVLVVIHFRRIRNVTNFFILSLAISDLIFVLLCVPSTYITAYLIQYWPFSNILCVFLNYMQNVSVTLVVYTLIWITLDKFLALVRPLKQQRLTIKACKWLIIFTWLFSLFISLPIALFTQLVYPAGLNITNNDSISLNTEQQSLIDDQQHPQCLENWPSHLANYTQIYNFFLLFAQYFLPLVILTFCYIKIGIVLYRAKAPGESIESRDLLMLKSRKKMLKMCFILVLSFVICWLPMQFITVYRFVDDSITNHNYFGDIFFACHSIAVSRSFLNPFIYSWTNARFRQGFKYFLFFLWIGKKTSSLNRFNINESIHMNLKHRIDSTRSNIRTPTPIVPVTTAVATPDYKKYSIRYKRNKDLTLPKSDKDMDHLNSV